MINTHILLWETIEGNKRLRVRVRVWVRFLLFYSELAPTLTRDVTWPRPYFDGRNVRRQCQLNTLPQFSSCTDPAWKVSKYGVFSGRIFPHSEYLSAFSPNTRKCGPGKTPYLDTFHTVWFNRKFTPYWPFSFVYPILLALILFLKR